MFKTGQKADFERMLDETLNRAKLEAVSVSAQVLAESAARGSIFSSGTPVLMEQRLTPIHDTALFKAMRLIVDFSERTGIPIGELRQSAESRLVTFTGDISRHFAARVGPTSVPSRLTQARARFDQTRENALKDVEIGFIEGRSAIVTENSTNQSKALRLLQAIYDSTRDRTDPVFIEETSAGLSAEDAKAAWRYLKDRGLIDTFSIPYTARINGAGVDAIEGAKRHPDEPSASFPSVSYNIVHNTMNVGTMSNSPIQQGGVHSSDSQTATYTTQDIAELGRLVRDVGAHLNDLQLDQRGKQKVEAQLATLSAQLSDVPDFIIVRQAGRTLRNVIEGAVASLVATAVKPTVWVWVSQALHRLFN